MGTLRILPIFVWTLSHPTKPEPGSNPPKSGLNSEERPRLRTGPRVLRAIQKTVDTPSCCGSSPDSIILQTAPHDSFQPLKLNVEVSCDLSDLSFTRERASERHV